MAMGNKNVDIDKLNYQSVLSYPTLAALSDKDQYKLMYARSMQSDIQTVNLDVDEKEEDSAKSYTNDSFNWKMIFVIIIEVCIIMTIIDNIHNKSKVQPEMKDENVSYGEETMEDIELDSETKFEIIAKTEKVGYILQFGKYVWQVLAVEDNKALIVTTDIVCNKEYNTELDSVTWETSSLRKWLNEDFYNEFGDEEKERILKNKIVNSDNPNYGISGGNDTEDNVFLLSIEEANKYFSTDSERKTDSGWWLRSPGSLDFIAAIVDYEGHVLVTGGYVDCKRGVRPALWIRLD